MRYAILDNEQGILVEHKDKNKLLKLFQDNEIFSIYTTEKRKQVKIINKAKKVFGVNCILLLEIN